MENVAVKKIDEDVENVETSTRIDDTKSGDLVTKYLIDALTGRVLESFGENDKITVRKQAQMDYYENHKHEINRERLYDFGEYRKFFMFSESAAREMANEKLTGTEFAVMFFLMSMTNYKSGLIAHGNNRAITRSYVSDYFKLTKRHTNEVFDKLIDLGVVAENITEKTTKYFFNPFIQYRGQWINRTLYDMFVKTKWAMIAKEERLNKLKGKMDKLQGGEQGDGKSC